HAGPAAPPVAPPVTGSPAVSGQPSARVRFCTACPAAPLTRLSRAEKTTTRPGAASWTEIRQSLVPTTSERRGGLPSTTRTKGAPPEEGRRAPPSLGGAA